VFNLLETRPIDTESAGAASVRSGRPHVTAPIFRSLSGI
jgi:hypothetical protein